MNYSNSIYPLVLLVLFLTVSCEQQSRKQSVLVGQADWRYFGQATPGKSASIFSPDIISTDLHERDFTISPKGNEIFYSIVLPGYNMSTVVYLYHDGAFWSSATTAPFSGQYNDLEPSFSPDGNKVFFISKRPTDKDDENNDWNIWYIEMTASGWSNPHLVNEPVNSDGNEYFPSIANNGNLYYTAQRDSSLGGEDIWFSKFENGNYSEPENLGPAVNSEFPEFNAFIDPEEKFIIFSSAGRDDDIGGGDLYISKKDYEGNWAPAKNMGFAVNSEQLDYCPFVTIDKRYMFFTSQRLDPSIQDHRNKSLQKIKNLASGIENGLGNIFWVEFDF